MSQLFGIVQYNENTIVSFKARLEMKDSGKFLIMIIGVIGRIPTQKLTGYVLFVNYEGTYKVNFNWTLSELNEDNRTFQCGTATYTFVSDSGEFVDENKSETIKSLNTNHSNTQNYRFILPRTSLQQLCINYTKK
ncbi:hypothetical protein GLOIN_2v1475986 [Rhizophagus clarus]|uniref:Uncharacterized protein n=1 Tax=Rhizophagus clarus TaxID=94130 RepID=A0A8H3MH05_9GLOM|nr:hypothetical protein GLOIN_2v1475986 [Rhizophagus clarus]